MGGGSKAKCFIFLKSRKKFIGKHLVFFKLVRSWLAIPHFVSSPLSARDENRQVRNQATKTFPFMNMKMEYIHFPSQERANKQ